MACYLISEARPEHDAPEWKRDPNDKELFTGVQSLNDHSFAHKSNLAYILAEDMILNTEVLNALIERRSIHAEELLETQRFVGEIIVIKYRETYIFGIVLKKHLHNKPLRPDIAGCIKILQSLTAKYGITSFGFIRDLEIITLSDWEQVIEQCNNTFKGKAISIILFKNNLPLPKVEDSQTLAQQLEDFKCICKKLADANDKPSCTSTQFKLLNSLPQKFSIFRKAWECTPQAKRTTELLISRLLREDKRLSETEENQMSLALQIEALGFKRDRSQSMGQQKQAKSKKDIEELKKRAKCEICKEKGHWARECPTKKSDDERSERVFVASAYCISDAATDSDQNAWIADSGANMHMSPKKEFFTTFSSIRECMKIANNKILHAVGRGTIVIRENLDGKVIEGELQDVYFVPELKANLFSIPMINARKYSFHSYESYCEKFSTFRMAWECTPQAERATKLLISRLLREDKRLCETEENQTRLALQIEALGFKRDRNQSMGQQKQSKSKNDIDELKKRTNSIRECVKIANNKILHAVGRSTIVIRENLDGKVIERELQDVYFVPELKINLFSIPTINARKYSFHSYESYCEVRDKDGKLSSRGVEHKGLFRMLFEVQMPKHTSFRCLKQGRLGKTSTAKPVSNQKAKERSTNYHIMEISSSEEDDVSEASDNIVEKLRTNL
ncbi:hypothetical protein TSAR_006919 [Trichomalopsis sarcophagae]|uniref:CCHC-type domain-containing protein n=1 Tax=Trichomalopsis sarcophagae TaxID=543379 RepID=A0A232EI79_9HYME|nr:hypothetical protein TSAR_006919 [Trichomalopsis sarcophagae]